MSSLTALTSQILANATLPILELSATTTTRLAHLIMTAFVCASTSWCVVQPGLSVNAVHPDKGHVEVKAGEAGLRDGA